MMSYDSHLWLKEKKKRCSHFGKRKVPAAVFKCPWKQEDKPADYLLDELRNKLLHIEEEFVINPEIWSIYEPYERILGWIEGLEGIYQIILAPIHGDNYHTFFSLYVFRDGCASVIINLQALLKSLDINLWEDLISNPPTIGASARENVEWFMRQSRGIKVCLDQFYRARSYGKAYGYLIAVFSFMENIYHFIHRLHIAELSTNLHNDELTRQAG